MDFIRRLARFAREDVPRIAVWLLVCGALLNAVAAVAGLVGAP
jgi:hypothetical protein